MLANIGIISSIILSIISLVIAMLSYRLKVPKVKIVILNKRTDCFFGNAYTETNDKKRRISVVQLRLFNNSPAEITLLGIVIKIKGETFRLVDCANESWACVEFLFPNQSGEETTDGSGFNYCESGIIFPNKLGAYDAIDFLSFFHNFPKGIHKQVKARVVVYTSIGCKSRKLKLLEYDETYFSEEWKDVQQYYRSIED